MRSIDVFADGDTSKEPVGRLTMTDKAAADLAEWIRIRGAVVHGGVLANDRSKLISIWFVPEV